MTPKTRERAARVLLSSLLTSDLTASELRELSEEMLSSPDFLANLSILLRDLATRLSHGDGQRKHSDANGESRQLSELLYSEIQRRRLSKADVLALLSRVSPTMLGARSTDLPLRRLLRDYLIRASQSEREQLVKLLSSEKSDDPYLRGILKRY